MSKWVYFKHKQTRSAAQIAPWWKLYITRVQNGKNEMVVIASLAVLRLAPFKQKKNTIIMYV